jgi:hypothetical protein
MSLKGCSAEVRELFDFMRELSERHYGAGWVAELEYLLWEQAEEATPLGDGPDLTAFEICLLQSMRIAAGGWIVWDDDDDLDVDGPCVFLPIEIWRERYTRWCAAKKPN